MTDINLEVQENTTKDDFFGTESIGGLFAKVVIPSIIAMVIMGVQGIIDGLFLGNFIGANAMASASIASPVLQIIMAFSMIIGIGGTAFIGRCLGENDIDKARDIFKSCFITIMVVSLVVIFLGGLFSEQLATLFGANDILLSGASDYIKIISILSPFAMYYMLFSFTNRIIGKPHLFLIASIVCVFANIGFNYLFIVVFQLEMTGAALATSLAYALGFAINLEPILNKKTVINIYVGKFDLDLLKKALYNGSSEGISGAATAITVLVFNLTFIHFYGESGVSAFTIVSYIAQFTSMIMFGMADGVTPIVSYNFGAKLHERVKKVMCISVIGNTIVGVIAFLTVLFFGENLIRLFADGDAGLIELTYFGAKIYAISFLFSGFNLMISAYFTSTGDALKSVMISSSRGLIFILLGIFTLPWIFDVTGVWLVAPFADVMCVFVSIFVLTRKPKVLDTKEVIGVVDAVLE